MKSPLILRFPIWLFYIEYLCYLYLILVSCFCEEDSHIYRLHFATAGIPSKIYI